MHMGKAVPKGIKAKAEEIQKYFPDKVTDSFDQNKALLNSLGLPLPKTNRNLIAGFMTRKFKQAKKAAN